MWLLLEPEHPNNSYAWLTKHGRGLEAPASRATRNRRMPGHLRPLPHLPRQALRAASQRSRMTATPKHRPRSKEG
jgi:hypothetical protein